MKFNFKNKRIFLYLGIIIVTALISGGTVFALYKHEYQKQIQLLSDCKERNKECQTQRTEFLMQLNGCYQYFNLLQNNNDH